jgi:MFS family permease
LFAGKLIKRFGAASVVTAGVLLFSAGLMVWAMMLGAEPAVLPLVGGITVIGIGVGLTFPTLMGVSTGSLPPSLFATGSGVVNMIRQAGLAIGVAMFVTIIGTPTTLTERVVAFHRGWWVMAVVTLIGLVPTYFYIHRRNKD